MSNSDRIERVQEGLTPSDRISSYRGHLKMALLRCLMERDMHGLEMINRMEEITSGDWRPSPGSVYPQLQEFERKGLIRRVGTSGRPVNFTLTGKGKRTFKTLRERMNNYMVFIRWITGQ